MSARCCCCSPTALRVWDLKRKDWGWPLSQLCGRGGHAGGEVSAAGSFCNSFCCLERGPRVALPLWKELMGCWSSFRHFCWLAFTGGRLPCIFYFSETVWCASPWQPAFRRQEMSKVLQAVHLRRTCLLCLVSLLRWEFKLLLIQSNHWCSSLLLYQVLRGNVCARLGF